MTSIQWLQFTLSYAVQVSLVVGLAWGLERWANASRVKTQVWSACFVSLIGMLFIGLLLPRLQSFHPWSTVEPRELLTVANTESVLGLVLLAVWVFGSCVMFARWGVHFIRLHCFFQLCPKVSAADRNRIEQLGLLNPFDIGRRSIDYRIGPTDTGAFCYQFHRPIVCLPQSLIEGDPEVLRYVLHHELTHLRTEHPLHLFFQKTVHSLLWFHPLVWISAKRANLVREFVCDDAATAEPGTTISYLQTLVKIVEQKNELQTGTLHDGTLGIGRTKNELGIRAHRLASLIDEKQTDSGKRPVLVLLLLSVVCSQLWLPTDPLASANDRWSPWPQWSATTLHAFDISVRDFSVFDASSRLHELREDVFEDE